MNLELKLFSIISAVIFLDMFLLLFFASTTVKKLKNNPATKESLGFEFVSGYRIFTIAQTLAWPQSITKKNQNKPLSFLQANSELIHKHTNKFDKVLAILFYWPLAISTISLLILITLSKSGFFK